MEGSSQTESGSFSLVVETKETFICFYMENIEHKTMLVEVVGRTHITATESWCMPKTRENGSGLDWKMKHGPRTKRAACIERGCVSTPPAPGTHLLSLVPTRRTRRPS